VGVYQGGNQQEQPAQWGSAGSSLSTPAGLMSIARHSNYRDIFTMPGTPSLPVQQCRPTPVPKHPFREQLQAISTDKQASLY
jgi:hypothetical protein